MTEDSTQRMLNVPDLREFAGLGHPVVILRLTNGDLVIGLMLPTGKQTDEDVVSDPQFNLRIQFPMLVTKRVAANGVPFVALDKMLPFTPFENQIAIINTAQVVSLNTVIDQFAEYYFNSFVHIQTKVTPSIQEAIGVATEALAQVNAKFAPALAERITHEGTATVN